jgi:GT2 family glycosyltransferase
MKNPKVTIGVILYKNTKYLAHSLSSLLDQDYDNIEYSFRDQSPNGEVYNYLEESHPEFFQKAHIKKAENKMHSGGHNAMMRKMKGQYYICASNDMYYPKIFVSDIILEMEKEKAKVATCKLMKWDYEKVLADDFPASLTRYIDSFGIGMTRGHQFFDAGQGKDEREIQKPFRIIGPSGALAVYHKDALKEIAYKNKKGELEYFDENLHYKNDVDLAYRLSWAGFPCLLADTKVYHDRLVNEKTKKSQWMIENSLKGHLITLQKNFDKRFSLGVKIRTLHNLKVRFLYTLLRHPSALKAYKEVHQLKKEIEKRKKAIKKTASPQDIQSLMS